MNDMDIDLSKSSTELFPESQMGQQGVTQEQVAEAHNAMGVTEAEVAIQQQQRGSQQYNWEALRAEAAKLKEEREYWKGQAEAFDKTVASRVVQPEPQREDPYKKFAEMDWTEGDNIRNAFETLKDENARLQRSFADELRAVKTQAAHPDWNQAVTTHVPELTSKNPIFAEMIRNVSNPYEAAYALAQLNSQAKEAQATRMSPDAQRAMSNASKPASVNTVGGHAQLSSADYYANMSDKDFMELAARNLASI